MRCTHGRPANAAERAGAASGDGGLRQALTLSGSRLFLWPMTYSREPIASDASAMPPIHQNHVPTEMVAPKIVTCPALLLISGVHDPDSVAMMPTSDPSPPITEQAQNTAGCASLRASNCARYRRKMISTSTNSTTIDRHQITVTAAWRTSKILVSASTALPLT